MSMGILFNLLNGYMQGQWIFHLAPEGMYGIDWFMSPWFILGTLLFYWYAGELALGLYHPAFAKAGEIPATICLKRDVPLRYFRQLLRRNSRVGRLGDTHLFTFRTCVSFGGRSLTLSRVPTQSGTVTARNSVMRWEIGNVYSLFLY